MRLSSEPHLHQHLAVGLRKLGSPEHDFVPRSVIRVSNPCASRRSSASPRPWSCTLLSMGASLPNSAVRDYWQTPQLLLGHLTLTPC